MKAKDWDRISQDYYKEILSPIKDSKKNPLFDDLKALAGKRNVIDLGCGVGPLLPNLSKRFKEVTAVDFSQGMLDNAQKANPSLKNVQYKQADLKRLKLKEKYSVVVAVNSILAKNINQVEKILKNINNVIKPGGFFLAVIPAMEVYLYQASLIIRKSMNEGKTATQARTEARKHINKKEHDFITGNITFDGDTQKCFYRFEINYLWEKAGFSNVQIEKVLYPWKEFKKAGQLSFPNSPLPWDWYVRCVKPRI